MGCNYQSFSSALKRMYLDLVAEAASGRQIAPEAVWLVDNHAFLQTQIREVCESLPAAYWRRLPRDGDMPRIYGIARELAELAGTDFAETRLLQLLQHDG